VSKRFFLKTYTNTFSLKKDYLEEGYLPPSSIANMMVTTTFRIKVITVKI